MMEVTVVILGSQVVLAIQNISFIFAHFSETVKASGLKRRNV